ncbi:porin [Paraburkholderia phytofirmans OLGA172]|uniref:Porin n=2 Tax=Paraburkholderia phytofirmans TaxID=261302 RepID=A0A160FVV5_9BURK|nr:porin [Paraburkholderia phytofirmans OLGA172]
MAHAQSSFTLYGIVDSGLMWQSRTPNGGGSAISALDGGWSPSVWGVTGAEDLGSGYKVHFKLEGGMSTTSGSIGNSNGGLFGRNAYVGMSGPFGQINAGLQFSPFFLSVYSADPRGLPLFADSLIPYLNNFLITGIFDSNALVYTSPTVAGLSGSVEYAFGNVAGSFAAGRHISAALNYNNGPISATASYFEAKDATSGLTTFRGENIGAGYRLGPVTVKLVFTTYRNPSSDAGLANVNVYTAGAQWDVNSVLTLDASVCASRDRNVTANKSMLYGAGAQYLLSKRTALYAQVGVVDNKGAMNTTLAANAAASLSPPQGTTVGVNVGIRHEF